MVLAMRPQAVTAEMVTGSRTVPVRTHGLPQVAERDVVCLGCARVLARVALDGDRRYVRPPRGEQRPLLVDTPRGARCQRCGGYPFIEQD